jgi:hypothetical protein
MRLSLGIMSGAFALRNHSFVPENGFKIGLGRGFSLSNCSMLLEDWRARWVSGG